MTAQASATVDPRVERTRAVVLEATAELLAEEGFGRITIDGVAERSGVARSTIYRNFPDRPALLVEAFRHLMDFDEPPDTGHLVEDLRAFGRHMADGLNHGAWGRTVASLLESATHDDDMSEALDRFGNDRRRACRVVFERAVDRGEIRPDAPIDDAQIRFVAPLFFLHLFKSQPLDDAFVHRMARAAAREVGAPIDE